MSFRFDWQKQTRSAPVDLVSGYVRLPSRCIADGPTRVVVGSVMRAVISGHRADELGVSSKLCAVPERQAVADAVVCLTRSVTTAQPVRPPGPLPPAPRLSEPSPG